VIVCLLIGGAVLIVWPVVAVASIMGLARHAPRETDMRLICAYVFLWRNVVLSNRLYCGLNIIDHPVGNQKTFCSVMRTTSDILHLPYGTASQIKNGL